jgi:hypothetical protein
MVDEGRLLTLFFGAILTGLPPDEVALALERFWKGGAVAFNDLREALPHRDVEKIRRLRSFLDALAEFYEKFDSSAEPLVVELPNGSATIRCPFCDHEQWAHPEEFAEVERSLAFEGCANCGHLHREGWWLER